MRRDIVSDNEKWEVSWVDKGMEAKQEPDPAYPDGIDLDVAASYHDNPKCTGETCTCPLPYPAKRCGDFVFTCKTCGFIGTCTTAGRADDPRSVRIPCQRRVEIALLYGSGKSCHLPLAGMGPRMPERLAAVPDMQEMVVTKKDIDHTTGSEPEDCIR